MTQISTHFGRTVHSMELFEEGDARQDGIEPVEMNELLEFLEYKRRSRPLSKSTAQGFKAAVSKFRARNGFAKFSTREAENFKRYLRGLGNYISESIRTGETDGDEGKRNLKREELESLCLFCVKHYEEVCSFKYGTEVHLFTLLGWNLCARSVIWIGKAIA